MLTPQDRVNEEDATTSAPPLNVGLCPASASPGSALGVRHAPTTSKSSGSSSGGSSSSSSSSSTSSSTSTSASSSSGTSKSRASSGANGPAASRQSGLPPRGTTGTGGVPAVADKHYLLPLLGGFTDFYPQSLWEQARQGRPDTDRLSAKSVYTPPQRQCLIAGKYVVDLTQQDFSDPKYRPPQRSNSRSQSGASRLNEFLRYSNPSRVPDPTYASPVSAAGGCAPAGYVSPTAATSTYSTVTTGSPCTSGFSDVTEEERWGKGPLSAQRAGMGDNNTDADEDDEETVRLPPIFRGSPSLPAPVRGVGTTANGRRAFSPSLVKVTYPVVEPLYACSAASFFFPVFYGRPSVRDVEDPRGLPQAINEEYHPNDRVNLPLSSVAVQKNNLNRMSLYKIGPGAVAFKVVMNAFEAAGMKYTISNSKFNILWAKRATPYTLSSLTPYQKVNHFPGTWGIGRKDSLAQNTTKMRRYFGEDVFDIVPQSFLLPRQEYELRSDAERHPDTAENPLIYIMKPSASSCGRGITLHRGLPPIPRGGKSMVCQRYIGNPLLIFGRKFDLRLYCVVTSFDPLRVYLFDEGLVRFAAQKYPGPDKDLENIHMHLTNYSVNKTAELDRESHGKEYDSEDPLDIKWCISDFKRHLMTHHPLGLEAWTRIQRECDDVVIKALLSIENDVIERVRSECKDRSGRNCFELFGLDLMADDQLKVRLIEVNIMPSLATSSSLDKAVKARMLAHLLTLVRAMPCRRDAVAESARNSAQQRQRERQDYHQQRLSNARNRSASRDGSASNVSRASDAGEASGSHAGQDSTVAGGERGSTVFPRGAEPERPERIYRFGRHPLASSMSVEKPLLKRLNDTAEPESMLSDVETLMLLESEEELRCAGGFRRIFPSSLTVKKYLPLFTHGVRRNNYLLISSVVMHDAARPKKD